MKNPNPKGKTPSLISGSSGKPKRVMVQKKSNCHRCDDDIEVGQDCFGIPKTGSFSSLKRYCKECFEKILAKTAEDLDLLKKL
jgi:hypothetical protein